ncbi:MAG: AsmA family protein, partial [Roseicyclus sp.]|nr:AsmA family protein [Roseicyclus sp.]
MRWIIRTILAILVLGLLAMGALLSIPAERIADVAAVRLQRATERPVRITGGIRPTLVPYLGVRVEGLEIGNPDWVSDGPMLQAEALNVGVNWQALIAGRIQLDQASLDAPRLVLVRAADGRESWSFGGADATPAPAPNGSEAAPAAQSSGGVLATLGFDAAVLRDATVLYRDLGAGTTTLVEALDLTLRLPQAGGTARAEASAIVNGSALTLDTSIDGIGDLLAGEVQPVTLALEWDGGTLSFDGRAGLDPAADGQLQLEARDLGPLMAALGQVAPTLPEGLGRDRIDVTGDVTLASEGSVHLRAGDVRLDDHRFTAELDLLPGAERPMLRGVIRGGDVDLSAMTAGENAPDAGRGGAAGAASSGWPRDPIDVSGLFAVDMDIAVTLEALDLGLASL